MMASRLAVAIVLTLGLCYASLPAEAQPSARIARIGVLGNSDERGSSPEQLVEGLRELGWIEGQNLIIERRYLEGDVERAPRLAAELVQLNVDVIVAASPPNARAAQQATSSIPIVLTAVSDPVGMGFVASLARPGGNITGVTSGIPEGFLAKQLELIKEAIPSATRVGILFNAANPLNYRMASAQQLAAAARASNMELRDLEIRSAEDIERAMTAANLRGLDAVFVVGDPLTFRHRIRIHELGALQRIPTFVPTPEYVEGRALAAYGPSLRAQGRHAAVYVDKILKGAKAADLPIEQPREYRLIVNLRAARTLGLKLPSSLVMRADEVIQ
jgi:putative ABC transport system substrate-binding protein